MDELSERRLRARTWRLRIAAFVLILTTIYWMAKAKGWL
jgi:hypothetical protein